MSAIIMHERGRIGDIMMSLWAARGLRERHGSVSYLCLQPHSDIPRSCRDIADVHVAGRRRNRWRPAVYPHLLEYQSTHHVVDLASATGYRAGDTLTCMIDAYCAIAGVEPARPQMGASVQHYAGPSIVYAPSSRERMRSLPDDIRAEIEKGLSDLGDVTTIGRGATMCGSIRDLLNLIASASVVVTVDTGALHIAGALGIPVVLISAAKPHDILMPHYIGVTVEPDAECAGCRLDHTSSTYSRQCLFGCAALEHVDAAAVISAAEASLSAQR